MKNEAIKLTCPSGITGTFAWLMRELAHHPKRFSTIDLPWFAANMPRVESRWRVVLMIRDLSATDRLPDDVVNRILRGEVFCIDGEDYVYDGVMLVKGN